MNTNLNTHDVTVRRSITGGLIILGIGFFFLFKQLFSWNWIGDLALPLIGAAFLVSAFINRKPGFLGPGCFLGGLGLANLVTHNTLVVVPSSLHTSAYLLVLSASLVMVTVLSAILDFQHIQWGALIPAAILAFFGFAFYTQMPWLQIADISGKVFPILLIALGGYLILKRR